MSPEFDKYLGSDVKVFDDANNGWRRLGDDDNDEFEDGPLGPERRLDDDDAEFEAPHQAPETVAIPIISPQAKATPLVFPRQKIAPIVRHNCKKPILNLLEENTATILRMERLRSVHSSALH